MKARTAEELRRTPIRKGTRYCSPLCGHGCLYSEFEEVTKKAAALAKKCGVGWESQVWENLGWHYSAAKGKATIYPASGKGYFILFNTEQQVHVSTNGQNVRALIQAAIRVAEQRVDAADRDIAALRG